jgi:hypothetical protein
MTFPDDDLGNTPDDGEFSDVADGEFNDIDEANDEEGPPGVRLSWGDRLLVANKEMSPRHRRLCELAAQGLSNKDIKAQLGYKSDSQVSIILSNTRIKEEIERIRDRIFEDSIGARLKKMAEPALTEIDRCLQDKTNKYKESLKVDTARWVIEKLDGKPMQKHEVGGNMLADLMDRLDNLKSAGRTDAIDVTPAQLQAPRSAESTLQEDVPRAPKTEEDLLSDWITDFNPTKV